MRLYWGSTAMPYRHFFSETLCLLQWSSNSRLDLSTKNSKRNHHSKEHGVKKLKTSILHFPILHVYRLTVIMFCVCLINS